MKHGLSLPSTDQVDRASVYLLVAMVAYFVGVLAAASAGLLAFFGGVAVAAVALLVLAGIGARAEAIEAAGAGGSQ